LIDKLDTDGNGTIEFSEFVTGATERANLLSKKNLRNAFAMIDKVCDKITF
jgi:Ca2+-binding EF-hand superfamily protein